MCCPLVAEVETDGENLFTQDGLEQEGWREHNPQRIHPPCSQQSQNDQNAFLPLQKN